MWCAVSGMGRWALLLRVVAPRSTVGGRPPTGCGAGSHLTSAQTHREPSVLGAATRRPPGLAPPLLLAVATARSGLPATRSPGRPPPPH